MAQISGQTKNKAILLLCEDLFFARMCFGFFAHCQEASPIGMCL